MGLLRVEVTRDSVIELMVDGDVFTVSDAERKRGGVRDTKTLRERLRASRGKDLPLEVSFYRAASGNEYTITGPPLRKFPEEDEERTR